MRVYLYPGYVDLRSAGGGSPKLFRFLERESGVKLDEHRWHGTLDSLPKRPAMIRASSVMRCDSFELAKKCAELGHFCFYDDRVILPNGEYVGGDRLIEEARKFVEKHKDESDVTREQTISYLRSISADSSTAGETMHALKQARILLDLFKKHVLRDDVVPAPEISGEYQVVRVANLEHSNDWDKGETVIDRLGFDRKGSEELGRQLAEDGEMAGGLPYDEPISQAYLRKLAWALEKNFNNLEISFQTTELGYELAKNAPSLDFLMHNFRGRHSQWGGVTFVRMLMDAMLPVLIERLVAEGYPENDEIVKWDYDHA